MSITFFYLEGAYRIPESEAFLPHIPVQPIGYDEAEFLFEYNLLILNKIIAQI